MPSLKKISGLIACIFLIATSHQALSSNGCSSNRLYQMCITQADCDNAVSWLNGLVQHEWYGKGTSVTLTNIAGIIYYQYRDVTYPTYATISLKSCNGKSLGNNQRNYNPNFTGIGVRNDQNPSNNTTTSACIYRIGNSYICDGTTGKRNNSVR